MEFEKELVIVNLASCETHASQASLGDSSITSLKLIVAQLAVGEIILKNVNELSPTLAWEKVRFA